MRFRLTQTAYLKPHPSSPVPILIDEGAEVDLPEFPGPYAVPLDFEAKQAADAYFAARGNVTLDPTRTLSTQLADGAAPHSIDQVVQTQLDRMLRAAGRHPSTASAPDPEVAVLREPLAQMQQQIAALTAAATPAPKGKGA